MDAIIVSYISKNINFDIFKTILFYIYNMCIYKINFDPLLLLLFTLLLLNFSKGQNRVKGKVISDCRTS